MQIQQTLRSSKPFFIAWCMLAAFGTYFCMYAFRKPFNAGLYTGKAFGEVHYKTVLIIAQVMGYMLSKFIGIKVISELRASRRTRLIIGLILFAEAALLLFGLVPYPYNFVCLFLNGVPLGMIWGVTFSYLEGRRFTEVLGVGLSISLIISSGFLKTIYFTVHDWWPLVSEFWLPFLIGLLFLPLFLLFVWMLSVIPAPTAADKQLRSERVPMTAADKRTVLKEYGWSILCFALIYIGLTTMRDFRDNFSVEIWNDIDKGWSRDVFAKTETITGVIVLLAVSSLSLFRNNVKGFLATRLLITLGVLLTGISTFLFQLNILPPFGWMVLLGMGLFFAYTPIQVALFERMIALFRIRANAGFFVYICDSLGYLGSVVLLLYKEFFMHDLSWSKVLIRFSYLLTIAALVLLIISSIILKQKIVSKKAA